MTERLGAMTDVRRRAVRAVALVVVVLALLYAVRVAWLFMNATEGDVPAPSALPLPAGTEILSESRDCASGGCWIAIDVRPPSGQTPEGLAEDMGATPQLEVPGNVLDPRTIWVWAEPRGSVLTLRADYFSQEWVP